MDLYRVVTINKTLQVEARSLLRNYGWNVDLIGVGWTKTRKKTTEFSF